MRWPAVDVYLDQEIGGASMGTIVVLKASIFSPETRQRLAEQQGGVLKIGQDGKVEKCALSQTASPTTQQTADQPTK